MDIRHYWGLAALPLAGCVTAFAADSGDGNLPNIIFVLADDLGYGDISCYGQQYFSTPNLDRLAEEGIKFTQHYTGCPLSAPSRSVLMSGLHMGHTSIRANRSRILPSPAEGQLPLEAEVVTIAEMLKTRGYVTGAFGKWGLGAVGSEGDPNNQGFDEFYGYNCQVYAHRYYPAYLWHNHEKVQLPGNDWTHRVTYSADAIQEQALEFLEENKELPFFLFYPTTLPHAELIVPEDEIYHEMVAAFPDEKPYKGIPNHRGENYGPELVVREFCHQEHPHAVFAAMIRRLDKYVGELVDKLEEYGLRENTIIIFASDNGPHKAGGADPYFFNSNGGLRGIKREVYEGGIRTPFIVNWPGQIEAGRISDHISAFIDLKPTLAEITGAEIKEKHDGISFLPELLGKKQRTHHHLYWEYHEGGASQAVRMGPWKAVRQKMSADPDAPIELYDLETDPSEQHDVASEHPRIVRKISRIMKREHLPNERFPFVYEVK